MSISIHQIKELESILDNIPREQQTDNIIKWFEKYSANNKEQMIISFSEDEKKKKYTEFTEMMTRLAQTRAWIESVARLHSTSSKIIIEMLRKFYSELVVKEDFYSSELHYKSHFVNWSKKKLETYEAKNNIYFDDKKKIMPKQVYKKIGRKIN